MNVTVQISTSKTLEAAILERTGTVVELYGRTGPQGATGATGATGAAGANGTNGTNGADGNDGADGQGFNFLGAYAGGTTYAPYDVVTYNGSTYNCILASTGNLPTNATYFTLMASKGDTGATGASGTYTSKTTTPASTSAITDTYLHAVLIPAGSIVAGDLVEIEAWATKLGTAGNQEIKLWYNSSNTLSGATQMAVITSISSTRNAPLARRVVCASLLSQITAAVGTSLTDQMANSTTAAKATITMNLNNNVYIIVSGKCGNAADTITSEFLSVSKKV